MAKEKKPPTLIKDLEKKEAAEKEKAGPGELTFVEKKNPMGNRGEERGINLSTVQALIPIIVSALVTIFIVFQMAPSKADFQAQGEDISSLTDSISGLTSQMSSDSTTLGNVVATMGGYAKKSELDSLKDIPGQVDSKLATLSGEIDGKLDDFEAILEELELVDAAGDVVVTSKTTRWKERVYGRYVDDVDIDYSVSPRKIEEEGDYRIVLEATNKRESRIEDFYLEITFTPGPGDRVYVDRGHIYLDTITSPHILWDVDVVERGDDNYCRRITAVSREFGLRPGDTKMEFEFTIVYR